MKPLTYTQLEADAVHAWCMVPFWPWVRDRHATRVEFEIDCPVHGCAQAGVWACILINRQAVQALVDRGACTWRDHRLRGSSEPDSF